MLKTYRAKIKVAFTADSAIVLSLPALKEDSTATPEAGTLSGHWNAVTSEADLTGTPSPSASVVRHEIRVNLGPEPDADDESMKAEFQLADTIVFHTDSGLATPGPLAHFRLVAVTADGHEKGTAWETIQRPL